MVWQTNMNNSNSENKSINVDLAHDANHLNDMDSSYVLDPRKHPGYFEDEIEVTT